MRRERILWAREWSNAWRLASRKMESGKLKTVGWVIRSPRLDDAGGLQPAATFQAVEYFSVMSAGARVKELIGDVGENGGASRRDTASGNQSEEAGEELAQIDSGGELGEFGEEVGREVFRVVVQLQGSGRFGQAEMVRTEAAVRLRASEAATLTVGVAIQATNGIVEGDLGRFRENGDAGIFR